MPTNTFVNLVDRKAWISEPSFTRWRSRFRGGRESFKLNSEMTSMLFNVRRLYEKANDSTATFSINLSILEVGGSVGPVYRSAGVSGSALGGTLNLAGNTLVPKAVDGQAVSLTGILDLQSRARKLLDRVKALEIHV